MPFTIVFDGDIRDFAGNPFKTCTPFGIPRAIALRDALGDADALREELAEVREQLAETRGAIARGA